MPRWTAYPVAASIAIASVAAYAQSSSGTASTPAVSNPAAEPAQKPTASSRHVPAMAALYKRMDIEFSDVSVRDAVKLISHQIGVPIEVADSVKSTARVTAEAKNVPAYHVLLMLVHQPGTTDLMISPKSGGILIEPFPRRNVNGRSELDMGTNPPWSNAWDRAASLQPAPAQTASPTQGTAVPAPSALVGPQGGTAPATPTTAFAAGASGGVLPLRESAVPNGAIAQVPATPGVEPGREYSAYQRTAPVSPGGTALPYVQPGNAYQYIPEGIQQAQPGIQWQDLMGNVTPQPGLTMNGALSVMVTALSDKSFVVTEPGRGPKGEFGFYLTVYRIDGEGKRAGETLREVSRVFHKSPGGMMAVPVMGGGMMGPGAGYNNYWLNAPGASGPGQPQRGRGYTPAPGVQPPTATPNNGPAPGATPRAGGPAPPAPQPPTPGQPESGDGAGIPKSETPKPGDNAALPAGDPLSDRKDPFKRD